MLTVAFISFNQLNGTPEDNAITDFWRISFRIYWKIMGTVADKYEVVVIMIEGWNVWDDKRQQYSFWE